MRDLLAAIAQLRERLEEIPQADEHRLPDLKTEILGRKAGALTAILARVPGLDAASRKEVGAVIPSSKVQASTGRRSELLAGSKR